MDDVRHYLVTEHLRDGTEVTIRAVRPDDKGLVLAAFKELEGSTIYKRFFVSRRDLTDRELEWSTEVDFIRAVALFCCIRESGRERIIGGGRYIAADESDPPDSAEVAFIVEEDYQGLGIASSLLRHLVSIGRQQGISRFEAEVLPSNRAMLRVFSRSGLPMVTVPSADSVHVVISLDKGGVQ